MFKIWQGSNEPEVLELIKNAWDQEELLIICPPTLKEFNLTSQVEQVIGQHIDPALDQVSASPILGVFTSGTSSGNPKLILYSKENLVQSLEAIRGVFDLTQIDTLFCYPQPTHAFGLILGYVQSLIYGLKLITPEGRYSRSAHDLWLEQKNFKMLTLGTPTHFEDLLSHAEKRGIVPTPTYSCIAGGAKVSKSLWSRIQTKLKIQAPSIGYGASEASLGVTHLPPGLEPQEDGEVGFALPHVTLEISDTEGVVLRGPSNCVALVQDGEVKFPREIILRDCLKRRESDGVHIFQGRLDLTLNRGGTKFSLEHLENVLFREFNTQVVCVPVPDSRLGEELGIVACISAKERIYDVLLNEVGFSFNKLNFIEIEEIPLNNNLKVDRQKCLKLFSSDVNV